MSGPDVLGAVQAIGRGFDRYETEFRALTRRAAEHFARRRWREAAADATRRLALYRERVDDTIAELRGALGERMQDRGLWQAMRGWYGDIARERADQELAETFFNSITRRIFTTVGVDDAIEFVSPGAVSRVRPRGASPCIEVAADGGGTSALARCLLETVHPEAPWADLEGDAERVAGVLAMAAHEAWGGEDGAYLEVLPSIFYRNKGAYVVGRLRRGAGSLPVALALLHPEEGVVVDAVLTTADELSIVFGFSWSYFQVDTPRPRALVEFLHQIMPHKRVDELYTAIGYNKHGKTELFRILREHLARPEARFETAEGTRGMVMAVFTLPSLNVVFKIIRDSFPDPKRTTRREVMEKYHLVFSRDRVGRLADAQEFEHLEFRRSCFAPDLLDELLATAGQTVRLDGERVIVRHLYTERRLTPLNLLVRDAGPTAAREAVLDYGQAIKDLAHAGIFTGDLLIKNFGVSRHGRVIFYDYDELALLSDCTFRDLPEPTTPDEELSPEPWFAVGEHDVFPEEFVPFLLPPGPLRDAFLEAHAELLQASWWRSVQERLAAGELYDVFPYPTGRRFRRG